MVETFYDKVQNSYTDQRYGKPPYERTIEELLNLGVINLDKPANPTSHEVTAWVKQILKIKKAGHGGTLDPAVTGCLPVALGKGTRALRLLLPSGKEYICLMKIHEKVDQEKLESTLECFRGKIYQTPPLRSNVKRQLRVRTIYELTLLEFLDGDLALLRISCEAGTYIRKLCNDIGLILGTGAHMQELRRTRTGPFIEEDSVTLQDLQDAWYYYKEQGEERYIREIIKPVETVCKLTPKIFIRDSAVDAICHGAALTIPGVLRLSDNIKKNSLVAMFTLKEELVAFGISLLSSKEILEQENGICIKTNTVFMEKHTYPQMWKKS
ncbi:MAG: RNA-guided pseudouridylation complex pseudouridine synthase subunit Cbf5 [Candidatus Hodarchaeales archaeon]